MTPSGLGLAPRHMDRKTPWRRVKKYCEAADIDPRRPGGCGIGLHSLRKTAINDAIGNGATMHEVREFAGHSDIHRTQLYFVRQRGGCRGRGAAHPNPCHGFQGQINQVFRIPLAAPM